MSNFLILLKIRLLSFFYSLFGGRLKNNGKKRGVAATILMLIFAIYIICCLFYSFGMIFYTMAQPLISAGLSDVYFFITAIMIFVFCFFTTLFAAKSQIFDSSDNDLMLSMPVNPFDILLSRISLLIVMAYLYSIILAAPSLAAYLMLAPLSAPQIIYFIFGILLLPLLSISVSCVLAWVMSVFSSKSSRKNMLYTLFSFAIMLLFLWFYYNIQGVVMRIAASPETLKSLRYMFAPMFSFGSAVGSSDIIQFIILILWCLIPFFAVFALLSRNFIKISTSQQTTVLSKSKNSSRKILVSSSSLQSALIKNELKRVFSIPIYLFNSCLGVLMHFIIAAGLIIKGKQLTQILDLSPELIPYFPALICIAMSFCSLMTCTSSCSVSMEGQFINSIKSMPLSVYDIFRSKIAANLLIGLPGIIAAASASCFVIPMSRAYRILVFFMPAVFLLFISVLGLILNILMPRFSWVSEIDVVKRSGSVVLTVLLGIMFIILGFMIYTLFFTGTDVSYYMQNYSIVTLILCVLGIRWLLTFGKEKFNKIGV